MRMVTVLSAVAFLVSAASGVECRRVGDGTVAGHSLRVQAGRVTLLTDDGPADEPLDAFREIVLAAPSPSGYPPPLTVWTAAGHRLQARTIGQGAGPDSVDVTGYGWTARGVPVASLRAVATRALMRSPGPVRADFESARLSPPPGHDLAMIAAGDRRQAVECVVESYTDTGVVLSVGDATREVGWDRCLWVVFAPLGAPAQRGRRHVLELTDGTRLAVEEFDLADGTATGRDGGATYTIDADRLARITVASDAYAYLSDLTPRDTETTPLLDVVWPPRMDASVTGGPLRLGGRARSKGIGMNTRTRMTFVLDGGYSRLHADVGIDQEAGDLGEAVFRVLGDGEVLSEVGPLRGGEAPVALSVDVSGVGILEIVADFGDSATAAGNFANWADARVVR